MSTIMLRLSSSSAKKMFGVLHFRQIKLLSVKVPFYFIEGKSGNKVRVEGELGKTVLDVAVAHDIDIEGACGGELACSTCHVIVPKELFDVLPVKKEEEDDMLDLAWGLKPT